ncbi:telomerase reverse transcriptase isoform X2 [Tasmannia lanceolata]|uniref:telomerase reverse transcriptase isoform X2 n=1 Tax=Tasmannia lanceolata TaxID=3420 RepID=UPI0040639457
MEEVEKVPSHINSLSRCLPSPSPPLKLKQPHKKMPNNNSKKVPEVLRRVYGHRVRTLAETIVSLLPPPECRCRGRICLGCSGSDAFSFLLRQDDPSDYHRLLTQSFALFSQDSPRILVFYPDHNWQQENIVRNTVELMMYNSDVSYNVICNGYDKLARSSLSIKYLSTSAWSLLLTRIGDEVMVHLLKFASIFLSNSSKNHLQVTGPPMNNSLQYCKYSKYKIHGPQSGCQYQQTSPVAGHIQSGPRKTGRVDIEETSKSDAPISVNQSGRSLGTCSYLLLGQRKKRRIEIEGRPKMDGAISGLQPSGSFGIGNFMGSATHEVDGKPRKRRRPFSWQRRRIRRQTKSPEENVIRNCASICNAEETPNGKIQQSSELNLETPISLDRNTEFLSVSACNNKSLCSLPGDMCQNLPSSMDSEQHHTLKVQSKKVTSNCFCSLILQSPQKFRRVAQIKRRYMFYNSHFSHSIFPRSHILNKLKPNASGANSLIKLIFGVPDEQIIAHSSCGFHNNGYCPIRSKCLYHSLQDQLKTLIRNSQCCHHLKLMNKHCPASNFRPCSGGDDGLTSKVLRQQGILSMETQVWDYQFELNGSYCRHEQVISFIWAVCRSIIPLDLLGAPSSWRALRRNVSKFVQLRRFEDFDMVQCMHGLKTSCFPFLSKSTESSCCLCNHKMSGVWGEGSNMLKGHKKLENAKIILKNKLFESWIFWFFSYLVVPMVRANFYVTETKAGNQDVFYYQVSIWRKLMNGAISSLKEQNYSCLDRISFESILGKRPFGFSKVRFLPKENGVRTIANMTAPSKAWLSNKTFSSKNCSVAMAKKAGMCSKQNLFSFRSVNSVLHDLHVVLNRIKVEHPEKLGSSVFDYNDIYRKLCVFHSGLRNGSKAMPRVFIVIGDVSEAFDSVDQDKLLSIMKDALYDDKYLVKKYAQVVCSKKFLRVQYHNVSADQSSDSDITTSLAAVQLPSLSGVLIDQGTSKQIGQQFLHLLLCEHVKQNILQVGQNFYLQEVGIPQGSVLSSLLCSFYYGHLERNVIFPWLRKICEHCTIRCENFRELGISRCLHDSDHTSLQSDSTCGGPIPSNDDVTCPGRLQMVNLDKGHKLCLQGKQGFQNENVSFPKYMLLRLIDDFLFISTSKQQASSFFFRMQRGFRDYNCSMNGQKFCMNFDVEHQSGLLENGRYKGDDGVSFLPWSGLLVNCQTLEIQADYTRYRGTHMSSRLKVSVQSKPARHLKEKLCDYLRPKCHPIFYDSNINSPAIVRLNAYQTFLLCAMKFHCYFCAMPNIGSLSPKYYLEIIQRSLRLKKEELKWLGLSAYIRALRKKHSRHKELILLLRSNIETYERMGSTSPHLKYAVDDSHSSMLWKIKY